MQPSSKLAYKELSSFKPRAAKDTLGQAEAKYDIPGITNRLSSMRGLVSNLRSSVESVDPSVTGRTSGTFTSEGQRQALVNKERAPILGDLGKQQTALGQEEQSFNTASSLASQMASALMNQDQQTYQKLLDKYNAATASEAKAEETRRFNETLAEQKRQADMSAKAASSANSGGSYDIASIIESLQNEPDISADSDPLAGVPKALRSMANKVFLRGNGKRWSDQDLKNDYAPTLKSAGFGNVNDKKKIELYHIVRPDLFGGSVPIQTLGNSQQLSY
jgi:hypothetical protein